MDTLTRRTRTFDDAFYRTVDFRYRTLRPLFVAGDEQRTAAAIATGPTPPAIDQTTARYRLVKMVMSEDAQALSGDRWSDYVAGSRRLDFAVNNLIENARPDDAFALYELAITIDEIIDVYCAAQLPTVLSRFRQPLSRLPVVAAVTRVLRRHSDTRSFDLDATLA